MTTPEQTIDIEKVRQKIRHLQAMAKDEAATDNEKAIAARIADELIERYGPDADSFEFETDGWYDIRFKGESEKALAHYILKSYGIDAYRHRRTPAKMYYRGNSEVSQLVNYEFGIHRKNLEVIIHGMVCAYIYKAVCEDIFRSEACNDCRFFDNQGKCACSSSPRHGEDVRDKEPCSFYEVWKSDKEKGKENLADVGMAAALGAMEMADFEQGQRKALKTGSKPIRRRRRRE